MTPEERAISECRVQTRSKDSFTFLGLQKAKTEHENLHGPMTKNPQSLSVETGVKS